MKVYNGMDMMDSLGFTVIEDQSTLDGASTSTVREHFKQWADTAPQREQRPQQQQSPEGSTTSPAALSQRYRYCIMVDHAALTSVIHDAPPLEEPDASANKGIVNLVWKDWTPPSSSSPGPGEEVEDPVGEEGCTLHDVGWMRVAYQDVMVGMYYYLRDCNAWYREYRRPPRVATA